MRKLEFQTTREIRFEIQVGESAVSELVKDPARAFFFVDSEVRLKREGLFNPLPHHVIVGGEVEKSVGAALELYPVAMENSQSADRFVVVGGGTVIDVVGYVVKTVAEDKRLIVIPTTLSSMVSGIFSGRFYLNYNWKKNLVSVPGSPSLIVIDPTFTETESSQNHTFGWLIALCNALSYDSNLFDYLSKSLFRVDLTDLVWLILRLRAENVRKGVPALGENLVDYVQEASGLRLAYPVAYAFAAIMELELSFKTGFLPMEDYLKVREVFLRFRPERRIVIDFSHVIERLSENKHGIRISVLQGIGKMITMMTDGRTLRRYMVEALERGLSLMG